MAVTVTVLTQKRVPGVGLMTTGTFNLSGSYAAGGDLANLALPGGANPSFVSTGLAGEYSAHYDQSTKKLRIFKVTAGVPTEAAAGPYTGTPKIPFFAVA